MQNGKAERTRRLNRAWMFVVAVAILAVIGALLLQSYESDDVIRTENSWLTRQLQTVQQFISKNNQAKIKMLQFFGAVQGAASNAATKATNLYGFAVKDVKGQAFDLSALQGKVVLIVNVASKCGFTGQYDGLQKLYDQYKDNGLEILGFPCNQFGGQEPGTSDEIQSFCRLNYGVSFPIMEKTDVNGDKEHPVYTWLKSQKSSLAMQRIKWNFEKFLIDKEGNVVDRFVSTTTPESLAPKIEALL